MVIKKIKIRHYEPNEHSNSKLHELDEITTLSFDEKSTIIFETENIEIKDYNQAIIEQNNTIIMLLSHIAELSSLQITKNNCKCCK